MRRFFFLSFLALGCGAAYAPEPSWQPGGEPSIPPAPSSEASAAPSAEAVAEAPPKLKEPEDPVPEHLGTPASSLAAAPPWWSRENPREYAPQPGGAQELFERARPSAEDPHGLACRFSVGNYRETAFTTAASYADINVNASINGDKGKPRLTLSASGPEDTNTMFFVVPIVAQSKGDDLVVEAWDRNVFSPDFLDRIRATYKGSYPLSFRGRLATAECRPLARADLETQFLKMHASVDEGLSAVEAQKPDLTVKSFGFDDLDDGGVGHARFALEYLSGLTGWDDPRVARRVARLDAAEAKIAAALASQADALRSTLPAPADRPTLLSGGALEVRSMEAACGPDVVKKYARYADYSAAEELRRTRCMVRIEIKNVSVADMVIDTFAGRIDPISSLMLISKSGGIFPVHPFGRFVNGKPRQLHDDYHLAPGATIELLAAAGASGNTAPPDPPFLLRASRVKADGYDFARIE